MPPHRHALSPPRSVSHATRRCVRFGGATCSTRPPLQLRSGPAQRAARQPFCPPPGRRPTASPPSWCVVRPALDAHTGLWVTLSCGCTLQVVASASTCYASTTARFSYPQPSSPPAVVCSNLLQLPDGSGTACNQCMITLAGVTHPDFPADCVAGCFQHHHQSARDECTNGCHDVWKEQMMRFYFMSMEHLQLCQSTCCSAAKQAAIVASCAAAEHTFFEGW